MTVHLREIPKAIHKIIRKEQLRIELETGSKLKIEHVAYAIINEWETIKTSKNGK